MYAHVGTCGLTCARAGQAECFATGLQLSCNSNKPLGGTLWRTLFNHCDLEDLAGLDDDAVPLYFLDASLGNVVMRMTTSVEPASFDAELLRHLMKVCNRVGQADQVPGVVAIEPHSLSTPQEAPMGSVSKPHSRS